MLQYYSEHPLYAVIVIVLFIFAVFVLIKAIIAGNERAKRNREIMDRLKADNIARNDFAVLSEELISSSEPEKLFKGVGLNLQKKVADKPDMVSEFESMNQSMKYIYSVYTFTEDAEKKMSDFFRMNTKPLTDTAFEAVNAVMDGEFAELFSFEYKAYDPDDEETSCIPAEIDDADEKAAPYIKNGTVSRVFGEYIKNNASDFLY